MKIIIVVSSTRWYRSQALPVLQSNRNDVACEEFSKHIYIPSVRLNTEGKYATQVSLYRDLFSGMVCLSGVTFARGKKKKKTRSLWASGPREKLQPQINRMVEYGKIDNSVCHGRLTTSSHRRYADYYLLLRVAFGLGFSFSVSNIRYTT